MDQDEIAREIGEIEGIVDLYQKLKRKEEDICENQSLLEEPELRTIAQNEIKEHEQQIKKLHAEIIKKLVKEDKDDYSSVILELKAGAGGDEATLFTADVLQMYQRFASFKGWKWEMLSSNRNFQGSYKRVEMGITGHGAFGLLKYEGGCHRVQRIPSTDSKGRIHTSTITVAVMSQPSEVDVQINQKDLKIDTFRASGAGGQHVNTTDSAVRLTHIPTGIIVEVQEERSQHSNKIKALKVLNAKIYNERKREAEMMRWRERKEQVRSGDRHEKIRTYNFPQDRVTDHRLGLTVYGVDEFMDGSDMLNELIEKLKEHYI
jgi:peptide chain release factor 1